MANAKIPKGFLIKSVTVNDKPVKYTIYVPRTYDPEKPIPAIVFLNGAGECGTDGLKQISQGLGSAIMVDAEKWPFIVVFPQKQSVETKWEDEEAVVIATLNAAISEYNIDESRVYLTGLSQGGHGTYTIAAAHPKLFAAIAPICGWADKETAEKIAKLPIWIFHGDQDQAVTVDQAYNMEGFLKEAGGSCKLTIYEGIAHNSWDNAYRKENLAAWFLAHRKS